MSALEEVQVKDRGLDLAEGPGGGEKGQGDRDTRSWCPLRQMTPGPLPSAWEDGGDFQREVQGGAWI